MQLSNWLVNWRYKVQIYIVKHFCRTFWLKKCVFPKSLATKTRFHDSAHIPISLPVWLWFPIINTKNNYLPLLLFSPFKLNIYWKLTINLNKSICKISFFIKISPIHNIDHILIILKRPLKGNPALIEPFQFRKETT